LNVGGKLRGRKIQSICDRDEWEWSKPAVARYTRVFNEERHDTQGKQRWEMASFPEVVLQSTRNTSLSPSLGGRNVLKKKHGGGTKEANRKYLHVLDELQEEGGRGGAAGVKRMKWHGGLEDNKEGGGGKKKQINGQSCKTASKRKKRNKPQL